MNTIINPINGKLCNIYDREGIEVLKSYIKAYKYGGTPYSNAVNQFDQIMKKRRCSTCIEVDNINQWNNKDCNNCLDADDLLELDDGTLNNKKENLENLDKQIKEESIAELWPSNEEVKKYNKEKVEIYNSTYGQFDRLVNYILIKKEQYSLKKTEIILKEFIIKFVYNVRNNLLQNEIKNNASTLPAPINSMFPPGSVIKTKVRGREKLVDKNSFLKQIEDLELLKTILKLCLKHAAKNNQRFKPDLDGFPQIKKSFISNEENIFKNFLDDLDPSPKKSLIRLFARGE